MKRSNCLVLLVGLVLAGTAFAAVILLYGQRPAAVSTAPTELPTVYARVNIPLGTVITGDMVEARPLNVGVRPAGAIGDPGQVIGRTVRTDVLAGAQITEAQFTAGAAGSQDVAGLLPPGLRAMAVTVDQVSGVGTLINVGDRVDLVVGFTGADTFPVVTVDPTTKALTAVTGINSTSTKVLLQNMQVIGTIASPVAQPAGSPVPSGATQGVALTGQQELVILAVTAQQAEVIKFAQIDGQITLVLRSPRDFRDQSGAPVVPANDGTSGIVLKTLIDKYGILPPQVVPAENVPTR